MYTDFQYEYHNDSSYFKEKSQRASDGWKFLGQAVKNDPLVAIAPGAAEWYRLYKDPNSTFDQLAEAFGKGLVDAAMFATTAVKGAQIAGRPSKFSQFSQTVKIATAIEEIGLAKNVTKKVVIERNPALLFTSEGKLTKYAFENSKKLNIIPNAKIKITI